MVFIKFLQSNLFTYKVEKNQKYAIHIYSGITHGRVLRRLERNLHETVCRSNKLTSRIYVKNQKYIIFKHLLAGYMEWREWCSLYRAKHFDDLRDLSAPDIKYKFQTLYA